MAGPPARPATWEPGPPGGLEDGGYRVRPRSGFFIQPLRDTGELEGAMAQAGLDRDDLAACRRASPEFEAALAEAMRIVPYAAEAELMARAARMSRRPGDDGSRRTGSVPFAGMPRRGDHGSRRTGCPTFSRVPGLGERSRRQGGCPHPRLPGNTGAGGLMEAAGTRGRRVLPRQFDIVLMPGQGETCPKTGF
ncbi:MAG: hypothetical protein LBT40_07515 [Deltaproteobacteria bacterium]|jgi:hypothetical protein|nr:hypothetical protein [Deltaproteobacteria bacterium]